MKKNTRMINDTQDINYLQKERVGETNQYTQGV